MQHDVTHNILIVAAFVLATLATFQPWIPTRINLLAAGFACFMLSLLV